MTLHYEPGVTKIQIQILISNCLLVTGNANWHILFCKIKSAGDNKQKLEVLDDNDRFGGLCICFFFTFSDLHDKARMWASNSNGVTDQTCTKNTQHELTY